MRISPITNSYQQNFNGVSRLRLKTDATAKFTVNINEKTDFITKIICDIWYKGKLMKHYSIYRGKGLDFDTAQYDEIVKNFSKEISSQLKEDEYESPKGIVESAINEAYMDNYEEEGEEEYYNEEEDY